MSDRCNGPTSHYGLVEPTEPEPLSGTTQERIEWLRRCALTVKGEVKPGATAVGHRTIVALLDAVEGRRGGKHDPL